MRIHYNMKDEITSISGSNDISLPKYNNMHYSHYVNNVYGVWSYWTLIGFVDFDTKEFIEWAHDMNYSQTTNRHAYKLSEYLSKTHNIKTQRVTRDMGWDMLQSL